MYLNHVFRTFLAPTSGNNVKLTLVVYPMAMTDLETEHTLVERAVFPGIKVGMFDVELGFDGQKIVDKSIGSPILPCIKVKEPIRSDPT